ncbi:hypothetical protein J7K50_00925 [bacterium]|nr:hypothetical protein [bacterium]
MRIRKSGLFVLVVIACAVSVIAGCGGGGGIQPVPLPPGETHVTQAELAGAVTLNAFATGDAPSRFVVYNHSVYTLNSFGNTMSVHSADDYSEVATVSFPVGAGPYDVVFGGDTAYICGNGSNAVYRYSAGNAEIDDETVSLATAETADYAFIGPGDMAVVGGKLYVPLSGMVSFGDAANGIPAEYGPGRVAVIDLAGFSLEGFIDTGFVNPTVCSAGIGGALYIVCTGELQFDESYMPSAGSDGGLVIYNTVSDEIAYSINLGRTLPSAFIAFNATEGFIGSNLKGEIYRVRLDTGAVMRGPDDPITVTQEFTYISGFTGLQGLGVLAGSFNTDEVYFIDPTDDSVSKAPFSEPFSFSESDTFFGGLADIALYESGDIRKVFVLMGIANQVGVIDFSDLWDRIQLGLG